jgi:hypothetical protein
LAETLMNPHRIDDCTEVQAWTFARVARAT